MSTNQPLSAWELPQLLGPLYQRKEQPRAERPCKVRPHFMSIVAYVYRNRYATVNQIQRRFRRVLKSDRTARRHVGELESLGYVAPVVTRAVSPNFPKVLHITSRGTRQLRQSLKARGKPGHVIRIDRVRSNGYSAEHVLHEVLTTEFLLAAWQTANASDELELCQTERRSLAGHPAFQLTLGRRQTRLEPDAMFVHREQGRGLMCNFVELDTGSMRLQQMTAKFGRYEAWAKTKAASQFLCSLYRKHGASRPRPTFRVLTVVADQAYSGNDNRLSDLMSIATAFPTIRQRAWFTSTEALLQHQSSSTPLGEAVWYKAGELRIDVASRWQKQLSQGKFDALPPARLRQRTADELGNLQLRRLVEC